jgi:hypothetical protein
VAIIPAEEALHFRDYGPWLTWLGKVAVATDLERLFAIGRQGVSRQSDNGYVLGGRVVFQDLCRLPSINYRNRYIHQDQVRM